jgi:hypothetical protein
MNEQADAMRRLVVNLRVGTPEGPRPRGCSPLAAGVHHGAPYPSLASRSSPAIRTGALIERVSEGEIGQAAQLGYSAYYSSFPLRNSLPRVVDVPSY